MARKKTKKEKIQSGYRLKNFRIEEGKKREVRDVETFGYLDSRYIVKDLLKTLIVSFLMIAIILVVKFL